MPKNKFKKRVFEERKHKNYISSRPPTLLLATCTWSSSNLFCFIEICSDGCGSYGGHKNLAIPMTLATSFHSSIYYNTSCDKSLIWPIYLFFWTTQYCSCILSLHSRFHAHCPFVTSCICRNESVLVVVIIVRTVYRSAAGFVHMKIVTNHDGRFILGQFSQPFYSIAQMVRYYTVNKLPIKGAEHISLAIPVPRERWCSDDTVPDSDWSQACCVMLSVFLSRIYC